MKEENISQQVQEATPAVTPPPFRPNDQAQEAPEPKQGQETQEQPSAPTLTDLIAGMGLDEPTSARLGELTTGLDGQTVSAELLTTLARGITRDEDVQNADAAGYLRGRNEKIETVLHPQPQDEDETQTTPVFPRYCRRSIWD